MQNQLLFDAQLKAALCQQISHILLTGVADATRRSAILRQLAQIIMRVQHLLLLLYLFELRLIVSEEKSAKLWEFLLSFAYFNTF